MINKYSLNDRVSTIDNYLGTIRYIGNLPVWGTNTVALGIEWDDPSRGKNNGDLNGINTSPQGYWLGDIHKIIQSVFKPYSKIFCSDHTRKLFGY